MNYIKLKHLIRKHIEPIRTNGLTDCLTLAEHLGLIVKDSSECLKDFGVEDFPLNKDCHAIYALYKGQHTIYYNENFRYSNYSIATMITWYLSSHYLGEALLPHLERLGAAMIIIPESVLCGEGLAEDIASEYDVPLPVVAEYLNAHRASKSASIVQKIKTLLPISA